MRVCVSDKEARDKAYIDVELWEKSAEVAAQYLKKGREVLVNGTLCMSTWENDGQKRSKHYIKAQGFKFLNTGGGKKDEGGEASAAPVAAAAGDDDVPF
jgi:single-strand DNA-binding protein